MKRAIEAMAGLLHIQAHNGNVRQGLRPCPFHSESFFLEKARHALVAHLQERTARRINGGR